MIEKPAYYAILTASIRYDNKLKANEKLMYAEITALANKAGYCHASNRYFSELYNVTLQTVSTWISHLEKLGYIETQIVRKDNQIVSRKIYLCKLAEQKNAPPIKKNLNTYKENPEEGIKKNLNTPIKKNLKGNTTSINTTSINNIKEINKETSVGKPDDIPFSEIINYLNQKAGTHYRGSSKKTKQLIKVRWHEGFKLNDFKKVIDIKVMEWLHDGTMSKYLRPETLFGTKFESYLNEPFTEPSKKPNRYHKQQNAEMMTDWSQVKAEHVDPAKLAKMQEEYQKFKNSGN